jgi:hypothetical protein
MATVYSRINSLDFKYRNGIPGSNLHRRSGRGRPGVNRYEKENRSAALGHRTWPQPLLHLVHSPMQGRRHSGGLSSMGLTPMASGRCGELILPTLRWQWSEAAVTFLPQAWQQCGEGVSGVPEAMGKTPMGAADSGDPSRAVGSTRTASQGCGGG